MDFLIVSEVAEWLQISPATVRTQVNKKLIPHTRIRKEIRFKKSELIDWIGIETDGELPEILTPQEVGETLRIIPQNVRREINDGNMHGIRIGRLYRIPRRSFDAWVERSYS